MAVHPALIDTPPTPPKAAPLSSLSPPVSLPNSPRNDTTPSTLTSHFVQALHDYLPTSAAVDEAVSCLYFRKGAIIEVINRDPSGWWDGTTNGARGWFPSNFVGRIGEATQHYSSDDDDADETGVGGGGGGGVSSSSSGGGGGDEEDTRQKKVLSDRAKLLSGRVFEDRPQRHQQDKTIHPHQWDELMTDVARQIQTLLDDPTNQTLVYHIVSAVRAVLAAAEAVTYDAPVFKANPDLAKHRKAILATLSKLVLLSRKKPQAVSLEDEDEEDEDNNEQKQNANALGRELLKELNQFEAAYKKTKTARLSSASLIARAVPLADARHTLKNLADHQSSIQSLVEDLLETIRLFLADEDGVPVVVIADDTNNNNQQQQQPKATEMLKKTRDAVDAVRHFLAVVEHVCSSVGNLDYGHHSIIPQDPDLVALVLAKEAVYSAITRLVTGVRALAGNPAKDDFDVVEQNCRTVADAILDCQRRVRVCLGVSDPKDADTANITNTTTTTTSSGQQNQQDTDAMRQQLENSIETRRQQTLSVLGRKATTLDALQDQYRAEQQQQQQQQKQQKQVPEIRRSRALSRVGRTTSPLPPRPSSSKSTPITDRARRPRGMSVSSVKQRSDSLASPAESLAEPPQGGLRRTPSWLSVTEVTVRRDSLQSATLTFKNDTEPWFLKQRAFTEDELMVNSEGQVTGATVEALIEKLTQHEKSTELLFLRSFFYNFRLFTAPATVLDLLIKRFNLQPPTAETPLSQDDLALWTNRVLLPVRLRVYNVIKTWLESFFYYESDHVIEPMLVEFVTGTMTHVMATPSKRMMDLVRKRFTSREALSTSRKLSFSSNTADHLRKQAGSHMSVSSSPSGSHLFSTLFEESNNHNSVIYNGGSGGGSGSSNNIHPAANQPNINRSLRNTLRKAIGQNSLASVHLTEFDSLELARQLTLMESMLFCQIQPNEMIGQEFKKKVGQSTAVHVKGMIQRSTQITSWVSDTILREPDAKKRAQIIKFWIKIGDHCLQLRNYNTLMAIRSALDSTSIARLKRTWECVSHKYKAMYDPIYKATDSGRNFAEYRRQLRDAIAPCLPFLGVYLTDMTFIDDGNANTRTSVNGVQLINFDKYIKTTRILNEIDQFQIPYKLTEVEEIQRYLLECLETVEKDDQVFYTRSLQIEPREEEFDIKSFISNLA